MGGLGLYCRKLPPTLNLLPAPPRPGEKVPGVAMHGLFPPVDDNDWCGSYEAQGAIPLKDRTQ
jgi:hypothetical protein